MRWIVASVIAILMVWGGFVASPYWAALDLVRAIETRDAGRLSERINTQALRNSLARQIASESILPSSQAIGPADRQLAAAALSAAALPLLDRFLTADGIVTLLRTPVLEAGLPSLGEAGETRTGLTDWLSAGRRFLAASRWRGFRNVYFALPPDRPAVERFRLQLRLSRFRWRLVSIDLPPGELDRLTDVVLSR